MYEGEALFVRRSVLRKWLLLQKDMEVEKWIYLCKLMQERHLPSPLLIFCPAANISRIIQFIKKPVKLAIRAGRISTSDIIIPAGPTGLDPGRTSFFCALNIATKISRGKIEICSPVLLAATGSTIQKCMAILCSRLGIVESVEPLRLFPYVFYEQSWLPSDLFNDQFNDRLVISLVAQGISNIRSVLTTTNDYQQLCMIPIVVQRCFFQYILPIATILQKQDIESPDQNEEKGGAVQRISYWKQLPLQKENKEYGRLGNESRKKRAWEIQTSRDNDTSSEGWVQPWNPFFN
eukprot:TRINITY_DN5112_c0_g1_i1.p1 TRINITY_DN5112_c0_g1~~TRINITY_DN5112_c0_g1_i1.p1  ORF type:complete len:292 (-),score=19.41 TRINITY_DN5112_c0_g1_i1:38-913(-)